jgi:hypothetical protein
MNWFVLSCSQKTFPIKNQIVNILGMQDTCGLYNNFSTLAGGKKQPQM